MLRKFIQWLLVGFSAIWLIASIAVGDFLHAFFMAAAVISLAPPTQKLLAPKLPRFLNTVFVQFVFWSLSWLALFSTLPPVEPGTTRLNPRQSAEAFNAQIEQYISIPNLKEAPSSNAKIDGKVLVVLKSSSALSGESINITNPDLMALVPEDFRANRPSDVKFIAWMNCTYNEIGRYSNGAKGYQPTCNVTVIDKVTSTVIGKSEDFKGSEPPYSTTSTTSESGDLPEEAVKSYLANLIQQS